MMADNTNISIRTNRKQNLMITIPVITLYHVHVSSENIDFGL